MDAIVKSAVVATAMVLAYSTGTSATYAGDDDFEITKIVFGGSGCDGTEDYTIEDKLGDDGLKDTFTIFFDEDFIVEQGPDTDNKRSKFCDVRVGVHLPQGYQFAILTAEYAGSTVLAKGVFGTQSSLYRFPLAGLNSAFLDTTIQGPTPDYNIQKPLPYIRRDQLGIESLVWSPCGRDTDLSIQAKVSLTGKRTPYSSMDLTTIDGAVEQQFLFTWRECRD